MRLPFPADSEVLEKYAALVFQPATPAFLRAFFNSCDGSPKPLERAPSASPAPAASDSLAGKIAQPARFFRQENRTVQAERFFRAVFPPEIFSIPAAVTIVCLTRSCGKLSKSGGWLRSIASA
jgi:hypothetical protein